MRVSRAAGVRGIRSPWGRRRTAVGAVVVAVVVAGAGVGLAGCSGASSGDGKDPTPTPTRSTAAPIATGTTTAAGPSGAAGITVTGGDEKPGTYALAYAPADDDTFDVAKGTLSLTWSDSAHHVLNLSMTRSKLVTGPVGATTTLRFGDGDKGYVDSRLTGCEVTVTALTDDAIAGRYYCRGLRGFSFADSAQLTTSVDAQGSFAYARKGTVPATPAPAGHTNAATVVVTGGDGPKGSYALTYDPSASNTFEPVDGRYDLTWSDSAHHVLNLSGLDAALKAGTKADMTTTIKVANDNTGFVDGGQTQCTVTLTRATATGLAGSFDCHDVQGFDYKATEELPTKLDAHGTFDYQG
ncbi:hypothetical protein [Actinacidiphila alni]|uniref:hypothetical protein n=1 Tax=Actinacidiphila alni TaxID=380248 RepID=UPI003454EE68